MKPLKILKVDCSDIGLLIIDDTKREYATDDIGTMAIKTDCGTIVIDWYSGVTTDGRSGGMIVDWLIPNVGDQLYRRAWFAHDCLYSFASHCIRKGITPPISFETANYLFYGIGTLSRKKGGGGVSKWRMRLAEKGVDTKIGRRAYDTADKSDRHNDGLIKVRWVE